MSFKDSGVRNLVGTAGNADLDCCDARLSFVRCVAFSSRVQFKFQCLLSERIYFYYYKNNLKDVGDGAMVSK